MIYSFRLLTITLIASICFAHTVWGQEEQSGGSFDGDDLLEAAQQQDIEKVKTILASGVDANSQSKYGATALYFAADRGNAELAKILLVAGADPNLKDRFYSGTPMMFAQMRKHYDVIQHFFEYGANNADASLFSAIGTGDQAMAKAVLASGKITGQILARAKAMADKKDSEDWSLMFADLEIPDIESYEPSNEELEKFVGKYSAFGMTASVSLTEKVLKLGFGSAGGSLLQPLTARKFLMGQSMVEFADDDKQSASLTMTMNGNTFPMKRVAESENESKGGLNSEASEVPAASSEDAPDFAVDSSESVAADLAVSSKHWPMFRGNGSRGVAQGQNPPIHWNVKEDENVKWKVDLEGLGLSCPSIWDDQIFLTSAVSESDDSGDLKTGLYGDVDSVEDDSIYKFNVYCINKSDGSVVWQQTANRAKPSVKRHAKSSHANPTVALDGKHVVAFFASEGLFCYSMDGQLLWDKQMGFLDSGWFYDADYQWGFASSPIIFEDNVIVQCDIQGDSFVACYALADGKEVWKTPRKEIPSWSSPVVHRFGDLPMLITYGTGGARGYDARDGQLLWELKGQHSEIVVPTPFVAHDLIFVCSGYQPIRPIYAVKSTARGDITLADGEESSEHVAWMKPRGGPYLPTPVVYGDYLYTCDNSGILTCYKATSGEQVYRKRMSAPGGSLSFSASVLAADGHLYFSAEDGRVLVVKAGPEFELVATNETGENVLATPAISEGVFYLRTQNSLIAIEQESESDELK